MQGQELELKVLGDIWYDPVVGRGAYVQGRGAYGFDPVAWGAYAQGQGASDLGSFVCTV